MGTWQISLVKPSKTKTMRKIFTLVMITILTGKGLLAQDDTDKKFRAGLRVAANPMWLKSNDPNTTKKGTGFGYGFGLATEFRLSDVIYFATGIGGDFENYAVKYRYDPGNNYGVGYELDANNEFVERDESMAYTAWANSLATNNTRGYTLMERKYKVTYVTIPIGLKMLTKEYGGFRYFGSFGGELGIRTKVRADDKYLPSGSYQNTNSNANLNVSKDASLIPMRVGMNIGLGAEYRIAGSTSLFLSVNYFRSFTNLMRNDSKFMYTNADVDLANDRVTFISKACWQMPLRSTLV
jgi:hypothetical protein